MYGDKKRKDESLDVTPSITSVEFNCLIYFI